LEVKEMKKFGLFMTVLCLWILLPVAAEPLAAIQSSNDAPVLKMIPDTEGLLLAKKGEGTDPTGWKKRSEAQDKGLERTLEQKEGTEEELLEKRKKHEEKWLKQEDKWRKKRDGIRNRIEKIEKEEMKLKGEKEKLQKELETIEGAEKEG
jgi:predicted ribosome quality control (RQC) complex YloA/Tae2 family protein